MTVDDLMELLESCHYLADVEFILCSKTNQKLYLKTSEKDEDYNEINPGKIRLIFIKAR